MRKVVAIALFGVQVIAGCGSEGTGAPAPQSDLLLPPPPGAGVQYRMTTQLDPGQEIERCQLVQAPPEGLNIQRDELKFTPGSHHVILYKTAYSEIPKETLQGVSLDGTKVHDCPNGPFAEWAVDGLIAGTQSIDGDTILGRLPDGVALRVPPGTVLVMNVHYLNPSPEPVDVDVRINLHTIPPEQVKTEAGVLFHFNELIRIPANGEASARMRCPIAQDISLARVQSHMHRRGVGFVANLVKDANGPMDKIYANTTWENVLAKDFDPPLSIKAGQALDFQCDYANPEQRDIMQGLTTRDEMCVLLGVYFPRNPLVEACVDEKGFPADIWVGSGAATCSETMACLAQAKPQHEDQGNSLFGCVVNSCPGAAPEVSGFVRCQMTEGLGACSSACSGSGGDCGSCMAAACQPQVSACQAVSCD